MGEEVFKDIYESSFKLSNYGIPLWNPEPSSANPVRIGDVGYIYRGQFIKSANIEDSDAENKPPITLMKKVLSENTDCILSPNIRLSTKAPTVENEVHQRQEQQEEPTAGIQISQGTKYTFTVDGSVTRGAILILLRTREGLPLLEEKRVDLKAEGLESSWQSYMSRNLNKWPEPAGHSRNDLILVHGTIMASKWAMVVFDNLKLSSTGSGSCMLHVSVKLGDKSAPDELSATVEGGDCGVGPYCRMGCDALSALQGHTPSHCLFLRAFKPTKNRGLWGWTIADAVPETSDFTARPMPNGSAMCPWTELSTLLLLPSVIHTVFCNFRTHVYVTIRAQYKKRTL